MRIDAMIFKLSLVLVCCSCFVGTGVFGQDLAPGYSDVIDLAAAAKEDKVDGSLNSLRLRERHRHGRNLQTPTDLLDETIAFGFTDATSSTFTISQLDNTDLSTIQATTYGIKLTPNMVSGLSILCTMFCTNSGSSSDLFVLSIGDHNTGETLAAGLGGTCPVISNLYTLTTTRTMGVLAFANTTSANGITSGSVTCLAFSPSSLIDETVAVNSASSTFTLSAFNGLTVTDLGATTYAILLTPDLVSGQTISCTMSCSSSGTAHALAIIDGSGAELVTASGSCGLSTSTLALSGTSTLVVAAYGIAGVTSGQITCTASSAPTAPTAPTTPTSPTGTSPTAPSPTATPAPTGCPFTFGGVAKSLLGQFGWFN